MIFSEKIMVFVDYLPTMQCPHLHIFFTFFLKYGFLRKSFNNEFTFVSWPFPVITFEWVQQQTHQKVMTKIVKKCSTDTEVHLEKKYCLSNPYFSGLSRKPPDPFNTKPENYTTHLNTLNRNFSFQLMNIFFCLFQKT